MSYRRGADKRAEFADTTKFKVGNNVYEIVRNDVREHPLRLGHQSEPRGSITYPVTGEGAGKARYREFAAAAMEEALAAATDELRHEYLYMAASWHAQATELEKE